MHSKKHNVTTAVVLGALCAALSVVFGKLFAIPVGNSVRISFESLPILLASLALGPFWGGVCGAVADLVGCAIVGYSVNPLITLAMVGIGVLPSLLVRRKESFFSVFFGVLVTHLLFSVALKSFALYLWYGMPLPVFLLRVGVSLVAAVLESFLLYELLKKCPIPFWRGGRAS